jgi:hypothetical protein
VTFPAPSYLARNEQSACGQRTYGSVTPAQHAATLTVSGALQLGTTANYAVGNGPANGLGIFAMSLLGDHVALAGYGLGDETLLLSPATLVVVAALTLDGLGAAATSVPLPNQAGFAGLRLYAQTLTISGSSYDSSRAIEVQICP